MGEGRGKRLTCVNGAEVLRCDKKLHTCGSAVTFFPDPEAWNTDTSPLLEPLELRDSPSRGARHGATFNRPLGEERWGPRPSLFQSGGFMAHFMIPVYLEQQKKTS